MVNKIYEFLGVMGILGVATGIGILIFAIKNIGIGKKVRKKYRSYIDDILECEEYRESSGSVVKKLENEELNIIIDTFIRSAKENTININTEVIIEEGVDNKLSERESKINNGSGTAVALGLLGTFIGLIAAILSIGGMLDANMTMESFINQIKEPIQSMALAFITTIAGVIGSLMINKSNRKLNLEKEKFYNIMEDYLDNNIVSHYQKGEMDRLSINLDKQFKRMTNAVEGSMRGLVKEMSILFEDGVEKLVNNIDESNLDLTKSIESLNEYSQVLSKLAKELKSVIDSFNEPVEKFNDSVIEYIGENRGFSEELGKTMNSFGEEMTRTKESFGILSEIISSNKAETEALKEILKVEFEGVNDSKRDLAKVIEKLNESTDNQTEEMKNNLKVIDVAYRRINEQLLDIDDVEKKKIREGVEIIKEAIGESNENLKERVIDELKDSMNSIGASAKKLSEGVEILIKMQTSSNERREYENKIIKEKKEKNIESKLIHN